MKIEKVFHNIYIVCNMSLINACLRNDTECALNILGDNPSTNFSTNGGITPLHIAVMNDNLTIVKALISKGADANRFDRNNRKPIDVAVSNKMKEFLKSHTDENIVQTRLPTTPK